MDETKVVEQKEFDLDKKVTVKNISGWTVGFARKADGMGDVSIAPNGSVRLSRNEIITQCQTGNRLFTGTDGLGSHATLYIDDAETRVELGFSDAKGKNPQLIYSDKKLKELFAIADLQRFKESFADTIRTRAEKYATIEGIRRLKLNEYDKIRFVTEYTGYKI